MRGAFAEGFDLLLVDRLRSTNLSPPVADNLQHRRSVRPGLRLVDGLQIRKRRRVRLHIWDGPGEGQIAGGFVEELDCVGNGPETVRL